jgi:peptidoglycan L-alanyl-D-glutamate endopeptidase CwlK
MIDSRETTQLHPTLQRGAAELIRRMGLAGYGYSVGISSTYRDNEYQNYLYEEGRSRPGEIRTNAKGGQSMHNYRLAFDIFQNIKGQEYDLKFLQTAGKIWQEMGGTWGGSWTSFPDKPHFEYTGGISLGLLQNGVMLPQVSKMKWEEKENTKMTQEEFNKMFEISFNAFMEKMANLTPSEWALNTGEWQKAIKDEIIKTGDRPRSFATREEVVAMILRNNQKKD